MVSLLAATQPRLFPQLVLMSSTSAQVMHRVMAIVALQSCRVTAEQYGLQNPIGVFAMTAKAVSTAGVDEQNWCTNHA